MYKHTYVVPILKLKTKLQDIMVIAFQDFICLSNTMDNRDKDKTNNAIQFPNIFLISTDTGIIFT